MPARDGRQCDFAMAAASAALVLTQVNPTLLLVQSAFDLGDDVPQAPAGVPENLMYGSASNWERHPLHRRAYRADCKRLNYSGAAIRFAAPMAHRLPISKALSVPSLEQISDDIDAPG